MWCVLCCVMYVVGCVVWCDVSCVLAECRAVDVPACPTLNCTRCGLNTVADAPSAVPSSEPLPLRAPPPLCQPTKCPSSLCVCSISSEKRPPAVVSTVFTGLVLAPLGLLLVVVSQTPQLAWTTPPVQAPFCSLIVSPTYSVVGYGSYRGERVLGTKWW